MLEFSSGLFVFTLLVQLVSGGIERLLVRLGLDAVFTLIFMVFLRITGRPFILLADPQ